MTRGINIYKVARECGVKLLDPRECPGGIRRPFECFSKSTLRSIGAAFGEEHLRLVLMLITGTRENARHLQADVIKAVSRTLASMPDLVRNPTLVADFNGIDLDGIRQEAKSLDCGVSVSDIETVILVRHFRSLDRERGPVAPSRELVTA